MENTLQVVLAKLAALEGDLKELASTKTRDHAWTHGGGARAKAHVCLDRARQAILAVQEAIGEVEVPRRSHTVSDDPHNPLKQGLREGHESFGIVEFTRPVGRTKLVGTMTDSMPSCVKVTVYRADRIIDTHLHTERYFHHDGGIPLIEFEMSLYQWAEAICNMSGHFNPCTLRCVMGTRLEDVPDNVTTPLEQIVNDTKAELFENDAANKFKADVDKVLAKVPELKLSKKKEEELVTAIQSLYKKHVEVPLAAKNWATERFTEETELRPGLRQRGPP